MRPGRADTTGPAAHLFARSVSATAPGPVGGRLAALWGGASRGIQAPRAPLGRALARAVLRHYIDFMFGINATEVAVLLGILVASALGLFLNVKLAVRQGSE